MKDGIFSIKWETGHIDMNVHNFFTRMDMETIKKTLRLARKHCSEAERQELLSALEEEKVKREEAIRAASSLRRELDKIFAGYIKGYEPESASSAEKKLVWQKARLEKVIQAISGEEWAW